MMNRPQIIVISPVRNEAWVLDAYLSCVSSWADRIILADQHSTDNTRDIAMKYPKVSLIENPLPEMNQSFARRLLFQEVDKIDGDKIVFALDTDEFLSPGFAETDTWTSIINSEPNSIFCFKWLNLYGDFSHYLPLNESKHMDWVCHLDPHLSLAEEYCKREQNAVHECRIPCLSESDCKYYMVDDIRFVHLARLNLDRTKNKEDFYQVSTIDKRPQSSNIISLYRTYHHHYHLEKLLNPVKLLTIAGDDVSRKVQLDDVGSYYIDEIISIFERRSLELFKRIDIWDNSYLLQRGVKYSPSTWTQLLFWYMNITTKISNNLFIRSIDAFLKRIVKL